MAVEPTIGSILRLQILEKDMDEENSARHWTCVSHTGNVLGVNSWN